MLSLLVVSLAVAVSAQYGPANDGGVRPGYPVYYPPHIFDWSSESREHRHRRQCPKLRTYLGEFPSIPSEAFYPPVIRYIKVHGRETALVVCDRDPKNTNVLFARRNATVDLRAADVASFGTTAGLVLTCDRRERRYVGTVLTFTGPEFTKERQIREFTCLGVDKTILGLQAEQTNKNIAQLIAYVLAQSNVVETRRKKRDAEATETPAVTEAPAEVVTEAAAETVAPAVVTEAPAVETEAPAAETAAPAAVTEAPVAPAAETAAPSEVTSAPSDPSDIDLTGDSIPANTQVKDPKTAVKVAISNIGKILGSVF